MGFFLNKTPYILYVCNVEKLKTTTFHAKLIRSFMKLIEKYYINVKLLHKCNAECTECVKSKSKEVVPFLITAC